MKNPYTKQAARLAIAYNHATMHSLREAYPSGYSDAKYNAEMRILEEMIYDNNGTGYRITGKNCCKFTCAYTYTNEDGQTMLRTHTAATYYDTPYMSTKEAYAILNA